MKILFLFLALICFQSPTDFKKCDELALELVADELSAPVDLATAPGDNKRIFILEQIGRVRIVKDGNLLEKPFIDLTKKITSGGERGLLGIAFHPKYAENGRFFLHYSDRKGDTQISEFHVTKDPDVADPESEISVMQQKQPFANHNGGQITFGSDGYLYISLGDGGAGGDPYKSGQNLNTLLGKILRIDINSKTTPYGIPADNPFAKRDGARPEIWTYGMRNAWKFSFDRKTQQMYIADVGQDAWEEIDIGVKGGNYGWNKIEGDGHCYPKVKQDCDQTGFERPIFEYPHPVGYSITGGFVYRGSKLPKKFQGHYFFGDYQVGWIRSFRYENGRLSELNDYTKAFNQHRVSSFGEDAEGEIYVVDHHGSVFKVVAAK